MTKAEAIAMLKRIQEPEAWEPQINQAAFEALDMAIEALIQESSEDLISRQAAIDALIEWYGCEPSDIGAFENIIEKMPSAQPERTCVNCGRTANNGGWYADGRTRCPIEEHYALPKDGYCRLWEKRNVTDDDYPERRKDEH